MSRPRNNKVAPATRDCLSLIGVARWLTELAARLAKDPDEHARVDNVRAYVADLVAGTAGEAPVDDIAFAAGLIGAALDLPPEDPDDGDDPPPCAARGGTPHIVPSARGVLRTPVYPTTRLCAVVGAF